MAANVSIEWFWIRINPDDTWSITEEKLVNAGVDLRKLPRSVYVIRAANSFSIRYPKRHSPTLYIGEGKFKQRISLHRKWLSKIHALTGAFPLDVAICTPRVTNNTKAHQEFEAHLLNVFFKNYGSLPLKNKIHENNKFHHKYDKSSVTDVIGPGKGKRYKWAIEPLKSNPFHKHFIKTHGA